MRVLYKKTAIEDILSAERYISHELHNTSAAKKLTRTLYASISLLAENPYMGAELRGKYDVDTDLRYLIVSKHLVFYRVVNEEHIEVTRILDGRQDYMAILF